MKIAKFSVLVFCALLILSACNGHSTDGSSTNAASPKTSEESLESTPTKEPSSSSSYEPGSPEGPALNVPFPAIPDKARKFTEEGAKSFTLYYFDLLNYAIDSADTKEIKNLSEASCSICHKSIIDEGENLRRAQRWQVGGKHHAVVTDSYISGKNVAIVTVQFTSDIGKVYSAPNVVHEKIPKQDATRLAFDLTYNKGWTVHRITGVD